MIDRTFIGHEFEPSATTIPRWEISQFARAIRDEDPVYFELEVAREQGYRDLPVPPTFFTKMTFSGEKDFFKTLGINFRKLLDGGRAFTYYSQAVAGDTIQYQTTIKDILEKEGKRGKMDVITALTRGKRAETGEKVFDANITLIVFH